MSFWYGKDRDERRVLDCASVFQSRESRRLHRSIPAHSRYSFALRERGSRYAYDAWAIEIGATKMSESTTEPLQPTTAEFRTPEMEQAKAGRGVPEAHELALEDINPLNANLFSEHRWHGHFERLRREDPVHFNEIESAGRYWSVTKYQDIKAVSSDWETFSSAHGITLGFPVGSPAPAFFSQGSPAFISQDPPRQTEQRKTVRPSVAPRNLARLEPIIRERTCALLDSLPEGETFDWVDTVSVELTTAMLATLFDFPFEDRAKLTRWSDIVFAIPQPGGVVESQTQKRNEFMECVDYFSELWEDRKKRPEGNDLVSMLVHGEATKHMAAADHLGNLLLLIVGGNDTTRNTMSGSVYALNKFPEQYDKLTANPGLVEKLVPEIIRWQTPLPYMRRTATRDCELAGKPIRKHDQLLMWYLSGNRDEDVFDNADALDIERPNASHHLSFGHGTHFCMGSRLAELQVRILWEEILQRFKRIEVQEEPSRTFSSFVNGYTRLPVSLTRK
ncbi:MAG: cytochrome P450 [Myxococcota bacterium]